MEINIRLWSSLSLSLSYFFLEWEVFHTKPIEKIKTHILCSITFFVPKIVCVCVFVWDNVEKYSRAGQATDVNMLPAHCMLDAPQCYVYTYIHCCLAAIFIATWMSQFYSKSRHGVDVLVIIVLYCTMGGRVPVLAKPITHLTGP